MPRPAARFPASRFPAARFPAWPRPTGLDLDRDCPNTAGLFFPSAPAAEEDTRGRVRAQDSIPGANTTNERTKNERRMNE